MFLFGIRVYFIFFNKSFSNQCACDSIHVVGAGGAVCV